MYGMVPPDPQTGVSKTCFAVIYLPGAGAKKGKRQSKRFPAGCVELKPDKQQAIKDAAANEKKFAAVVVGPSKSSEGQYIYYLQEWL